ncbi:MAG: alanine racemase [Deltaproteobacteria bacterium]|jgi:alanine racemase|nr:alanine racemase [Deltaproteobacteria bacterium]
MTGPENSPPESGKAAFLTGNAPLLLIHLDALLHNYRLLQKADPLAGSLSSPSAGRDWPAIMPVIKSDAYGHGLEAAGTALLRAGAEAFGVGTVEEAVKLRLALRAASPEKGRKAKILVLLGSAEDEETALALRHNLTVLLHRPDQPSLLAGQVKKALSSPPLRRGSPKNAAALGVAVKLNTDMNRLGLRPDALLPVLNEILKRRELRPELLCTHFSSADQAEAEESTREQAGIFLDLLARARALRPELGGSMCNSAALLNINSLCPSAPPPFLTHRPGIALYGSNPFRGSSLEKLGAGLKPVMQFLAPVLELRDIAAGSGVSYGSSFKAEKDMRIAILRAGYADAVPRIFSNPGQGAGEVILAGSRTRILGRVCMQMLAVEVPRAPDGASLPVAPGDWACLLGSSSRSSGGVWQEAPPGQALSAEDLALRAGTISYELFCNLGRNKKNFFHG